jgi:hypothetical protein
MGILMLDQTCVINVVLNVKPASIMKINVFHASLEQTVSLMPPIISVTAILGSLKSIKKFAHVFIIF